MRDIELTIGINAAAGRLGSAIAAALDDEGEAVVIWSGGNSPRSLVPGMSTLDLDWSRVTFLMGDERWVPLDHPQSNEGGMRRYLAGTPMERARIAGLYRSGESREGAIAALEAELADLLEKPACAALLGIGADGHTASLFPGGSWLDLPAGRLVTSAQGPEEGVAERISLTPGALRRCNTVYLLCNSPEKQAVWARASAGAAPADLPAAILLDPAAPPPVVVI
jgi:6-phosphogluconolactonase